MVVADMAWLGGSTLADKLSVMEYPGGRSGMGIWQDSNYTVWMFGGIGMSSSATATGGPVMLNDVWCFTNGNKSWHQVHPGTVSNLTVAVSRAPQIPHPRQLSSVCGTGHVMVLFGGLAEEDTALGDLWVFDAGKKVWRMLVDSYTPDDRDQSDQESGRDVGPEPRGDSAHWCTSTHLYIFGGVNGSNHIFSDMWQLSLEDFTWEELKSSKEAPASLRDHITADYPEGRNGAMTWTFNAETTVTLFMFGGNILSKYPRKKHIAIGYTSDMWQYAVSTDSWHYVMGSTHPGQPGIYGSVHEMSASSVPGCRRGGATWMDPNNLLWLFGGEGADSQSPSNIRSSKLLSDLWRFHPKAGHWEWMGGSPQGDAPASFKRKGRLSHTALAGGRLDAATWKQSDSEAFFLFGGLGHDKLQHDGYLSDLWLLDVSDSLTYHFYIPAVYGFAIIFVAVTLVLCLSVAALCARDRSKPPQWRRGGSSSRYRQLPDSDTG